MRTYCLKVRFTVFLLSLFWVTLEPVAAGGLNLKDTVKNLYGGDGITLAPPVAGFSHVPHFTVSSLGALDSLNTVLTSNLGVFSFNSTVTGFTFDMELGVPVRTTESLGPLLAERAPTLGARKLNVAFTYTRLDFRRLAGKPLSNLSLTFIVERIRQDAGKGESRP